MTFIKYASLENTYRDKHIAKWVRMFPELAAEQYVITEKIHGTNAQIISGETLTLASRNQVAEDHMGMRAVVEALPGAFLDRLRRNGINLYGELFGPGVGKGVDYGPEKRLLFFDMRIAGRMQPWHTFLGFMEGFRDLVVPVLGYASSLADALEFRETFQSKLSPDLAEGLVLKPSFKVYSNEGSLFYLKKKAPHFKEHASKPKVQDEEVAQWNALYKGYLTPARLENLFSREGPIESPRQIGEYLRLMQADAQEDFLKDYPECPKDKRKQIFNVGSLIANMLKESL